MSQAPPEPVIAEFVRYNNWANAQLLEACQSLSAEQLSHSSKGTFGTIRATWEHLIRAEAGYAFLLLGRRPEPPFRWEDDPGLPQMAAFAAHVGTALVEVAGRISPADSVQQEFDGKKVSYKAVAILIQIINHGIEHRTNITTILDQLGVRPPAVDGWGYLWSNLDQLEVTVSASDSNA